MKTKKIKYKSNIFEAYHLLSMQAYSILFLALALLTGCTFTPEDVYFKELDKEPGLASVNLNETSEEVISIYQPTTFTYEVFITKGLISEVQVLLNNEVISTSQSTSGTITLDWIDLETGTQELKIQFLATSGTGSLADKLGSEYLQVWRTWTLNIDVDPPAKPQLSTTTENGFFKISWDPYTKPNFTGYSVEAVDFSGLRRRVTINDPAKNYWIDSSYTGGYATTYHVNVSNLAGNITSTQNLSEIQSLTSVYSGIDSTVELRWKKVKYPAALKQYAFYVNGVLVKAIPTHSDTVYRHKFNNVLFGESVMLEFKVEAKYPSYREYKENYINYNPLNAPQLSGNPSLYWHEGTQQLIAKRDDGKAYVYSPDMTNVTSYSYTDDIAVPASGPYFYYLYGSSIYQVNLLTQTLVKTVSIAGLTTSNATLQAGANELILYNAYSVGSPQYILGRFYYDFSSETSIKKVITQYDAKMVLVSALQSPILSSSGYYAFSKHSYVVHHYDGTSILENYASSPDNAGFLNFRPDALDQYLWMDFSSREVKLYTIEGNTLVSTLPSIPLGYNFRNYDPVSKYLLFESSTMSQVYLMHIETGVQKIIPVSPNGNFTLLNGKLFTRDGYYYETGL